jgi:hypothetical protein
MLTDRDRLCLRHVETFGFITIKQATAMFYKDQAFGYDMARRRLNKLIQSGYLKVTRNLDTNEKVYYMEDKYKKITFHNMIISNYYSNLIASGATVTHFEREKTWANAPIRSDIFAKFEVQLNEVEKVKYYQIVEINISNHNIKEQIQRYEKLFDTGELQALCDENFPTVIVVDDRNYKTPIELPRIQVLKLDYKLDGFAKIFC